MPSLDKTSIKPASSKGEKEHKKFTSSSLFNVSALLTLGISVLLAGWALHNPKANELPSNYALCSREDVSIYTVDDADSVVQCIVIQDDIIVNTGPIGIDALVHLDLHVLNGR